MTWLNASDYLALEASARDRIEDLRGAADPWLDRDEESRDTPRDRAVRGPRAHDRALEGSRPRDTRAACWAGSILPRPRPG
jgi:hypothetical protein